MSMKNLELAVIIFEVITLKLVKNVNIRFFRNHDDLLVPTTNSVSLTYKLIVAVPTDGQTLNVIQFV